MLRRIINQCLTACALLILGFSFNANAATEPEYVLAAGDAIKITVFQNPDMTVETRVSENGSITYPLLGSVQVGGETTSGAEKKIADLLKSGGFVLQPQINVLVLQVRGNQVSVLGQVNRPGRYPLELANSKLSDVLALAGGVTPLGSDEVILTGVRDGKPMRMQVDIPSLFAAGGTAKDVAIQSGDMLYVHRAPQFYIYGEVQRPGSYRVERDMNLMQALASGGGVTARGTQRGIRVHRRDKDGTLHKLTPEMDELIQSDDVIYVRESLF